MRDAGFRRGTGDGAAVPAAAGSPTTAGSGGGESARETPAGGRVGPLSVRQRFLVGRRVDVNSAGWEEISGLPGISDAVARAVVERRRSAGPFRRAGDLLDVPGIKEHRLKKILPFLSQFPNN